MTQDNQEKDYILPTLGDEEMEPSSGGKGAGNRLVLSEDEKHELVFLARIGCTVREMCSILGKPAERATLERHYSTIIELGRSLGNMQIRKAQWEKAIDDKDTKMQIWLGKQRLGQAEIIIDVTEPLPWSDD